MGSATPPSSGGGPYALQISKFPFYFCVHSLTRTTKFDVVTHIGRGLVLGDSHAPTRMEAAARPQRSRIFGILLCLCVYLSRRTTKFDVVTHMEKRFLRVHQ